jgi:prepilin-type N-terminal cleavage/methylation domain-containing protein
MIKQMKKRKGTTLIEVTVVLGLLSIFSLIGVNAYCVYKNIIYDIEINQFCCGKIAPSS